MLEGRRYRALLDENQRSNAARYLGTCRYLHNWALGQRRDKWKQSQIGVSYADQCRDLTELRAETDWIAHPPQCAEQQVLKDVDQAYRNFWKGTHAAPRFHRKRTAGSVRFPGKECGPLTNDPVTGKKMLQPVKISGNKSKVRLPKLGYVTYRASRPLGGQTKNVTLSRDSAGDWWVSFIVDTQTGPAEIRSEGQRIGVDRGVAISACCSNGDMFQTPTSTDAESKHRKRVEQKLARQERHRQRTGQRMSNRQIHTKQQLAKLKRRDRRRRENWAHQTSHKLTCGTRLVAFEDLQIKNMTASAAGTVDDPGVSVAAKRGLNRAILQQGWGSLVTYTTYKGIRQGVEIVEVPAAYTSQKCSMCGYSDPNNRKNQATFVCVKCGHEANADINAAINIRELGIVISETGSSPRTCGLQDAETSSISRSMKRQPPTPAREHKREQRLPIVWNQPRSRG